MCTQKWRWITETYSTNSRLNVSPTTSPRSECQKCSWLVDQKESVTEGKLQQRKIAIVTAQNYCLQVLQKCSSTSLEPLQGPWKGRKGKRLRSVGFEKEANPPNWTDKKPNWIKPKPKTTEEKPYSKAIRSEKWLTQARGQWLEQTADERGWRGAPGKSFRATLSLPKDAWKMNRNLSVIGERDLRHSGEPGTSIEHMCREPENLSHALRKQARAVCADAEWEIAALSILAMTAAAVYSSLLGKLWRSQGRGPNQHDPPHSNLLSEVLQHPLTVRPHSLTKYLPHTQEAEAFYVPLT